MASKEVALRVVPVGNLDAVAGRLIARRVTGQSGADIFIVTGGHPPAAWERPAGALAGS